jgi:hypothetical protein
LVYEDGLRGFVQRFRFELGVIWSGVELDAFELAAISGRSFRSGRMVGSKWMDLKSQMSRPEPNSNFDASKRLQSRKGIDTGPDSVSKRDSSIVFVVYENVEFEQGLVVFFSHFLPFSSSSIHLSFFNSLLQTGPTGSRAYLAFYKT